MGESACLVRSFSNPADISCEAKEGDPIHALTESVSFGRFMSDTLAWEKWSTFSHNRHLEEVEKFSKPGSVAQKKAYFEAYYKRRAAMKAAALLEQSNTAAVDASQAGSMISDLEANANTFLALDEQPVEDVSDAVGVNAGDTNAGDLDVDISERGHELMEQDVNMMKIAQVENSEGLQDVDNQGMITATPDKKLPNNQECVDQKSSTSSRKRGTNSLSKSSTPSRPSKLPLHPSKRVASAQGRSVNAIAKSAGNSNDKKPKIPNSLHMSINFGASKTPVRMPKDSSTPLRTPVRSSRKAADQENLAPSSERRESNSTSKLSNHGGVSKPATSIIRYNHALTSKKSAADSNEQRRIVQKSLHMSMNFAPHASETSKSSPKIARYSPTPSQTPTRASINGGSKHPSKVLQPQDKRTRAVLNKSVSGGVTGDMRWPSSSNCSKSSSASGTSTRSSISFSPFSFRSEERAAKRKDFFKKLEDKTNSKEAEKSLLQTRQKNPSTWPQSPKFGRKPSSSTVPDANSRPPRKPSINNESSKQTLMKNNRIISSVTSLSRNRHENASPNIQHSVGKESNSKKHAHRGPVTGECSH